MIADDVKIIARRNDWAALETAVQEVWRWSESWDLPINSA